MDQEPGGNNIVPLQKPEQAVAQLRQQKRLAGIGSNAIVDGLFSLLEAVPGFATITDTAGKVLYMNQRGWHALRCSSLEEVYGRWLGEVYSAESDRALAQHAIPLATKIGSWRGDLTISCRDGSQIPVCQVIVFQRTVGRDGFLLSVAWDMRNQKHRENVLRHRATHDNLTGIPNRTLLLDRLQEALARSQRDGSITGIAFMDIDRFKSINDWLGHDGGDQVLKQAAARFAASVRTVDTVARYGGDEFVLILPDLSNSAQVGMILQRIKQALEPPFIVDNRRFFVTFSTGTALFPNDGKNVASLLQAADRNMYRAKRGDFSCGTLYHTTVGTLQTAGLRVGGNGNGSRAGDGQTP